MSIFTGLFGPPVAAAELPYEAGAAQARAARWVRWIASVSPMRDPIDDPTGEHAAEGQPDDLWFLAGSYGKKVTRTCTVPAGRPLFFPIIISWQHAADGPVERFAGAPLMCRLDGVDLPAQEVVCDRPFEVAGRLGNPVTGRRKPAPMLCSGLWSTLEPPAPGPHELYFQGDGGAFTVDVTYHLSISP
jgi:hypothetical protein